MVLIAFGTVVMYSASSYTAEFRYENYTHFLFKHMRWLVLGAMSYFFMSRLKYKQLKFSIKFIIALTWTLIILAFILNPTNKPNRWLIIGGQNWLTTSDLARMMLILYTAYFLDKYQKYIVDWRFMLKNYTWVPGITLAMILIQPDLSSTVIIGTIILMMLIVGKVSTKYLLIMASAALIAVGVRAFTTDYMYDRIDTWLDSSVEVVDEQQYKSMLALGRGKFFGNGMGSSRLSDGHLPAAHTDFILPIVGEEYGFAGSCFLFGLFTLIFHYGIRIVQLASDRFGLFLALGIVFNFIFYFLINVAYVIGFAPNTGLSMPFMSYGGSNTIFMLSSVGLLMAIAKESIHGSPTYLKRLFNG